MDAAEKLSATATVQFRPGDLGQRINDLLAELQKAQPNLTKSDLVRDGLAAFWPQISAYLLARQQTTVDTTTLARIVGSCSKAIEMGMTPAQLDARLMTLLDELHSVAGGNVTRFPVESPQKPARPGQ